MRRRSRRVFRADAAARSRARRSLAALRRWSVACRGGESVKASASARSLVRTACAKAWGEGAQKEFLFGHPRPDVHRSGFPFIVTIAEIPDPGPACLQTKATKGRLRDSPFADHATLAMPSPPRHALKRPRRAARPAPPSLRRHLPSPAQRTRAGGTAAHRRGAVQQADRHRPRYPRTNGEVARHLGDEQARRRQSCARRRGGYPAWTALTI